LLSILSILLGCSPVLTQIVVGASPRSRSWQLLQGQFVNRLIRQAADADLHVIAGAAR